MDQKIIKCIVWDLDNVVWKGILLENRNVRLRCGIKQTLKKLDGIGILHSIASKNSEGLAMKQLERLKIKPYFVYPVIGWGQKSASIREIAQRLNLDLDSFLFVDDDELELEEVKWELPLVKCIHPKELHRYLRQTDRLPQNVTKEATSRRIYYQQEIQRNESVAEFSGNYEEYLNSLCLRMNVMLANSKNTSRIQELINRTHQFNSTGEIFSKKQIKNLLRDNRYKIIVCDLEDKFGYYGEIGVAIIEMDEKDWTIRLLIMSCRVLNKGLGSALLSFLKKYGYDEGVKLSIICHPTDLNRPLQIAIAMGGFIPCNKTSEKQHYIADYTIPTTQVSYVKIINKL